jgi:hypothetical protein
LQKSTLFNHVAVPEGAAGPSYTFAVHVGEILRVLLTSKWTEVAAWELCNFAVVQEATCAGLLLKSYSIWTPNSLTGIYLSAICSTKTNKEEATLWEVLSARQVISKENTIKTSLKLF